MEEAPPVVVRDVDADGDAAGRVEAELVAEVVVFEMTRVGATLVRGVAAGLGPSQCPEMHV